MKRSHIPTLPVEPHASAADRRVRQGAPKFIESLIKDSRAIPQFSSLDELRPECIEPLSGGAEAATYLLRTPKVQAIIKFGHKGLEAEAEALRAWRARGAQVPEVLASGVVPATKRSPNPIKYVVEQALLDRHGRLVETCASFLTHSPEKAREVGRLMGVELNKLHGTSAKRHFGDFADSPGSLSTYKSWSSFMKDYLRARSNYLRRIGVTSAQLTAAERFIDGCQFVKRGRYVHGDFSIRNAAISGHEPLKVSLFDPNPMIGDPTWDVANHYNNYEFHKRRAEHDGTVRDLFVRDQQLFIGFRQGYTRRIRQDGLLVARLIQASLQAEYKESAVRSGRADRLDVRVRREFIHELVKRMVRKAGE